MKCPKCDAEMESGTIYLKAWGIGLVPQAQLNFDKDRLWSNTYVPVAGLFGRGSKVVGNRCKACQFVAFQYPGK
jgi:hypothetical protein